MKKNILFCPYQMASSFVIEELKLIDTSKYNITVLPNRIAGDDESVCENLGMRLDDRCAKFQFGRVCKTLGYMLWGSLIWRIPLEAIRQKTSLGNHIRKYKLLFYAYYVYTWIKQHSREIVENDYSLYSFWCTHNALAFSIAKKKIVGFDKVNCVTRAHRGDLYETAEGFYFPLREFIFKNIDKIYTCSEEGREYLEQNYPQYGLKFAVSYLGSLQPKNVKIQQVKPSSSEVIFASCSFVHSIKRVDLIASYINEFARRDTRSIRWHHLGGGPLLDEIAKAQKDNQPSNLKIFFHGVVTNEKVHQFYEENYVDVFINLSTTEGLPVSIMEAISYGIPVVANDVGGVREIVNNETGVLLGKQHTAKDFEQGVRLVLQAKDQLRMNAKSYWEKNFRAEKNYADFYANL